MRAASGDLVPILTIIAGGVVGALLTFSPLVRGSLPNGVPTSVRYVPVQDAQSRVFVSNTGRTYRFRSVGRNPDPDEISLERQRFRYGAQPILYIDGVRIGNGFPENLDPKHVASIEFVNGDAAAELYGEDAPAGVYRIALKDARHFQLLGSTGSVRVILTSVIFALYVVTNWFEELRERVPN